jgi:cell wall-associated NlpC family hydrolase
VIARRLSTALILLASAGLLVVFAASPALATPISANKARAQQIRRQVAALDMRFEKIVEQYNQANGQLAALRTQIRQNTQQLQLTRYNLSIANRNLKDRAVALYKQQPVDLLDVIFSSSSFQELTTQLDLMNKLSQHDSDIISSVRQLKQTIADRRAGLMVDRTSATKLLADASAKKHTIQNTLAQRRHMLRGVESQIRRMEAAEAARARRVVAQQASGPKQRPIIPSAGGAGHPEVCAIAAKYLGIPYLYGGASPSTGFDCSGFVMYVYAQVGIGLPHYSGAQQQMGTPVPMNELLPGDLVFRGYPAYHVGMYVGSGMVIHSPHTGAVVSYQSVGGWDSAVRLP